MSLTPGITIQTTIQTSLLQVDNSGTAFLIATANWGTENTLQTYIGASAISTLFKTGALPVAANIFVAGKGRTINTYRFVPNDAIASTQTLAGSTGDAIDLTGKYKGTYGNSIWTKVEAIGSNRKLTISDDKSVEIYDNNGNGYSSNADLVSDINENSSLVTAVVSTTNLVAVVSKTLMTGGDNGAAITSADIQTIIEDKFDLSYDVLLVPELTDDTSQGVIANLMETRENDYNEFSIFVSGIDKDEAYSTTIGRTTSTLTGRLIRMAPGTCIYNDVSYSGGYTACYYAGLLLSLEPGESATHKPFNLQTYINYANLKENYNQAEVSNLIANGFTVINKLGNIKAPIRAVTSISDITNPFFEQSIRRSIDLIKSNLINLLNPFIGQKNTAFKRIQMKGVIDSYLNRSVDDTIISEYESEVLDTDVPTEVSVNLILTPVYPINQITINLTI